jgi:hypothetical protein
MNGPAHAGQWLLGTAWITDDAGKRTYGQYISVFLTRNAIPVPADPGLAAMERHRRFDSINQMHLDFFKTFSAYRHRPGYLAAHTESSDSGNFAFLDVPAGDYFLVVTFPAMIGGYKVAWQQPVTVRTGRTAYVTLNDDNLALPTDRRH